MKKLLSFLSLAAIMAFAISCGDDDEVTPPPNPDFDAPTVTAGSVADLDEGASGTATFNVTVDSDLTATWAATASGGITLTASSGDVSGGSIDVAFDATTAGAASISLTVTDSEGQSASATTTAFNVIGDVPVNDTFTIIDATEQRGPDEDNVTDYPQNEVTGIINRDYTFTNDKVWVLNGRVIVDPGATLTIEPGTIIKGAPGSTITLPLSTQTLSLVKV
ncbi:MAG: hypothetical protein RIC80_22515 [Cyclobacteriaceae bacterium]